MKKILFLLIIFLFSFKSVNAGIYGRGEIKLSYYVQDIFIEYIKGGHGKTPSVFVVAKDGSEATFWYCPAGQANCMAPDPNEYINICEREFGKECAIFARNRTIRWKSEKNPGKGKKSKFNSKWDRSKMINKLKELGFVD